MVDLSGASGFCADCCFWGTDFGFMPKEAMYAFASLRDGLAWRTERINSCLGLSTTAKHNDNKHVPSRWELWWILDGHNQGLACGDPWRSEER